MNILAFTYPRWKARSATALGERPRAKILIEASTESEWVSRCLEEWATR